MAVESGFPGFDEQPTLLTSGDKFIVTSNKSEQPNIATVGSDFIRDIPQNIENLIITNLSTDPLIIRINPHTREQSDGTPVVFSNTIILLPTDPPFELRDRPIFKVEVEATEDAQTFRYDEW